MANPNHPLTNPIFPSSSSSSNSSRNPSTSNLTISLSAASLMRNANPWRPSANAPTKRLHRHFKDLCDMENTARMQRGEVPLCNVAQRELAWEKLLRLSSGTEVRRWVIWVDGVPPGRGGGGVDDDGMVGVGGGGGGVEEEEGRAGWGRGVDGEMVSWYDVDDAQVGMERGRDGDDGLEGLCMPVRRKEGWRKDSKDVDEDGRDEDSEEYETETDSEEEKEDEDEDVESGELGTVMYAGDVREQRAGVEHVEVMGAGGKKEYLDFVEELAVSVEYRDTN
ncbi:hypothetical protein FB567DRAFT_116536 [Paraphoma chrysanthemicola]|uniref:Uncharacterized protein n=1 Tax=Paraphoma chrysanthemicola TaxID=798071 RepID=A0A8K0VWI9_9PLEO|nr:hypothetical protein FB567DRAFT_116536 [Paraphoma chrysanthemicola]